MATGLEFADFFTSERSARTPLSVGADGGKSPTPDHVRMVVHKTILEKNLAEIKS
jgi:hypothetical protein